MEEWRGGRTGEDPGKVGPMEVRRVGGKERKIAYDGYREEEVSEPMEVGRMDGWSKTETERIDG